MAERALVVRRVVCGNTGGNLALLHGAAQINDRQQGEDEIMPGCHSLVVRPCASRLRNRSQVRKQCGGSTARAHGTAHAKHAARVWL